MELETPIFVERDPDIIMAESKATLEGLLGRELQPAQVEQLILQFIVYREVLLVNRFNAGMSQLLYQFSKAPILDYIASLVAIERLPASNAGCTIRFTLVPGHGSVLIPDGTRIATTENNVIFMTTNDTPVTPNVNTIDLKVEAEIEGKQGNGYAPGGVSKILDPLAFVSTATNVDTTGGGSDVETDDQLRERIKLAPSQYSSAGSRSSYQFYAKSANPLIIDVSVDSPTPGVVMIVPLTELDHTDDQVITDVYNACNPENVRPLTDTVVVAAPRIKNYTINLNIELYEDTDADSTKASIAADIAAYVTSKKKRLGQDIILSHIAQICRKSTVYDVSIVSPAANVVVGNQEFANCTQIDINITGFNRG